MRVPKTGDKWIRFAFTLHLSSHAEWDETREADEDYIEYMYNLCANHIAQWPIKFAVLGREQCPETGSHHFQGYLEFKRRTPLSDIKMYEDKQFVAHWGSAYADWENNWVYCTKDDPEPIILGDAPKNAKEAAKLLKKKKKNKGGQAEKNRWESTLAAAKEGRWNDIPADLQIRYYQNLKRLHADNCTKPDPLPDYTAEWIYGEPGCGKSHAAREENPDHFSKTVDKWWCGYQNEDCVIIEDIDSDSIKSQHLTQKLKIWLDKYCFTAEVKGTSLGHIRPKKFVITSNYPIEACFNEKDAEAISRRVKIRHFVGKYLDGEIKEYNKEGEFVQDIYPKPEDVETQIETSTPPTQQVSPESQEDVDELLEYPGFMNGPSEEWHKYNNVVSEDEDYDNSSVNSVHYVENSQDSEESDYEYQLVSYKTLKEMRDDLGKDFAPGASQSSEEMILKKRKLEK